MPRAMTCGGLILVLLMGPGPGRAQVGNYWSEQYGNRSMLLSGAVIGSVADLGLVFYNPARLTLIQDPAFLLTAKAYQWKRVHLGNGLGDGLDLNEDDFGTAPSLAAGAFRLPFWGGPRLAYAFLSRRRDKLNWSLRVDRYGGLLDQYRGSEFFSGTTEISTKMNEEWMGVTWAGLLGENWNLGLSSFYFNLQKNARLALGLRALTEANEVAGLSRVRSFGYRDQGVLWKVGLAGVVKGVDLGVTVTTPRLSLWGSGTVTYEDLLSGLVSRDGAAVQDVLITEAQSGLPAKTRSPWAIGAGVGLTRGRTTLHLSGEWYSAVPRYTVTEARPFQGQSTGETMEFRVVEQLRGVVNGAIGIEWHRDENLSLFGSLASDRSAASRNPSSLLEMENEASTTTVRLDYPQVAGGVVISTSHFDLTFGGSYAWAGDWMERPVTFPDGGGAPVFGSGERARLLVTRWRFLVGFSFPFADQIRASVMEG